MKQLTGEALRGLPLPQHDQGDNKEGRGQVLVVGGCLAVPGAILLSAEGALRAGAGKLQIATCRSIAPQLGLAMPEAMVIGLPETAEGGIAADAARAILAPAARADAVLVGPGVIGAGSMAGLVTALLQEAGEATAFVFDAGALDGLSDCVTDLRRARRGAVITPHAGEMARLLDISREAVEAEPLRHARQAASELGCTVVLKGGTSYVVNASEAPWVFDGGTIGLATSGSGDVLAGIIAGLLARGASALHAALWGVYLHAEAGRRLTQRHGGIGLLARELPAEIPSIMAAGSHPP
ncbi:NAD(P)H-hydrate dehydratase [Pseudoroseomonas deserti]|uniref:ADP-dependent (S)-NAD(P)H-hydrate dehydratase n=1 Tax=Teichococcus deserti TaxID=1817963 RepID=A0A1V2GVF9_9PROT|nr:NAD(P)H-hydrate dehydratase [Pseudoroseomonas deserti]ONG45623.1 NAD(P)H-hydrate dehydratase [Pseudoroseomonas deserti]